MALLLTDLPAVVLLAAHRVCWSTDQVLQVSGGHAR
ncbi:hypothetical protein GA0074692_1317 [Micromonospora pallida]|uniref:Uncharacterized protein n=1 Tax=Micromonospora pallida TaxID=145854 RepID=A0A1C6RXX2_9ACTN|nr:hypothetical protein GA0074692_1317 [Micromonospora pallida]